MCTLQVQEVVVNSLVAIILLHGSIVLDEQLPGVLKGNLKELENRARGPTQCESSVDQEADG